VAGEHWGLPNLASPWAFSAGAIQHWPALAAEAIPVTGA